MAKRLTEVDDLIRLDHYYLDPGDRCYFLGEYTARGGYAYSDTNQLIFNFKKSPDRKGRPEWRYKGIAINTIGNQFRQNIKDEWLENVATLVPIPPSKTKSDPMYDDRLIRMLQALGRGLSVDIRELVLQRENMEPAHSAANRPTPEELAENYVIDESLVDPRPNLIAVFDDMLTSGCHFKAMQLVLQERFPGVPIVGFFAARRVPDSIDVEDIDITELL